MPIPTNGLVAEYKFDDETGLSFGRSTSDYLDLPYQVLDTRESFSISFWVRTADSGDQSIVSCANSGEANEFLLMWDSATAIDLWLKGNKQEYSGLTDIVTEEWVHCVYIRDTSANKHYLYINDSKEVDAAPSTTDALDIDSGGLIIGQDQDSLGGGFQSAQSLESNLKELRFYNRAITSDEVNDLYTTITIPTSGLVAEYINTDETWVDSGKTTVYDTSTNSYDGNINGCTIAPHDTSGNDEFALGYGEITRTAAPSGGHYMDFDGSNDYIYCDPVAVGLDSSSFSVVWWMKSSATSANDCMIAFNTSTGGNHWLFQHDNGVINSYDGSDHSSGFTANDGEWHFIGFTCNDGTNDCKWYIDGEWKTGADFTSTVRIASNDQVSLGMEYDSTTKGDWYLGGLNNVRFYNRVLDTSDMEDLYNEFGPTSSFNVESAVAQDYETIRVTYDAETYHASATSSIDALNPDNYTITSGTGINRDANSVSLIQADPTIVDLDLSGEMTNAATYTVAASGVLRASDDEALTIDSAQCFGIGILPRVSSVTAQSSGSVLVNFNEAMDANAALVSTVSYTITGDTTPTKHYVTTVGASAVNLVISEMKNGGTYTLTVASSGVTDQAYNPVDPLYQSGNFTGIGVHPQVSTASAPTSGVVRVVFDEAMEDNADLTSTASYAVTGTTTLGVSSVSRIDSTTVDVYTSEMRDGGSYTIVVYDVVDLADNVIDPLHNSYTFTGFGRQPRVDSASVPNSTTVRLVYDEPMADNAALVSTASYSITGDTVLTPSNVTRIDSATVDVTTNEMQEGGSYTITVASSGVTDLVGNPIDPAYNSAPFTGSSVAPQVSSASAQDANTIRATFNKEMANNGALVSTSSYSVTGATALSKNSVTRIDGSNIDIDVSEMLDGGVYTFTVVSSGVHDLVGNPVDPLYDSYTFSGIGDHPQVSTASAESSGTVRVIFNEEMENNAALVSTLNYSITGDTSISISNVTRIDGVTVDLTTNEMKDGGSYTVTVATSGVTDLVGNTVDPLNNYFDFSGIGVYPRVSTASALASGTVQVVFNEAMENNADLVSTASYSVTGDTTPSKISVTRVDEYTVNIAVSEMKDGGSYVVVVSDVVDLADNVIDPVYNHAYFSGIGVRPQVASAVAVDATTVRIVFDEEMTNNADLTSTLNYTVTGASTPAINTVTRVDGTTVDLDTEELINGGSYTVVVENVIDVADNVIDPLHNYADFVGVGVRPKVLDPATVVDTYSVYLDYDEAVQTADAINSANYGVAPSLGSISVSSVSSTRYKLTFSNEHLVGTTYTITVSNVRDLAGNTVDPLHNTADFDGTATIITWVAEVLIGDTVIWSSTIDAAQQTLGLDVSAYTGVHLLRFRIRAT
jgi:hypothetical protein